MQCVLKGLVKRQGGDLSAAKGQLAAVVVLARRQLNPQFRVDLKKQIARRNVDEIAVCVLDLPDQLKGLAAMHVDIAEVIYHGALSSGHVKPSMVYLRSSSLCWFVGPRLRGDAAQITRRNYPRDIRKPNNSTR